MRHPEFPLSNTLVYLNHAAVSPWPLRSSRAVIDFAKQNTIYGSHLYGQWLQKEAELRTQFRQLLNAPADENIALVKNTSEALSFVAYGLDWQRGQNIVTSNQEFPSNRIPWQSLKNQGVELREADLYASNTPEDALFALVDSNTRLLTISSVQFASGLRLDLDKIGTFCKHQKILFCVDAIQSLGAVQFDVQACQADFVMADGHKWLCGPEGLGVFYSTRAAREQLRLTQYGWHMIEDVHNYENKPWEIHPGARRFECGSPNMLGIHALSASLSLLLETGMENVEARVTSNADYLRNRIQDDRHLVLLSEMNPGLKSGIVVFNHKTLDNPAVYRHLQENGIVCAMRGEGIRLSAHFYQTEQELDRAMTVINQLR